MGSLGIAALAGLFASFAAIGFIASRRAREMDTEDYLLAGRSLPLWLATMTMTATWVDGGYLLGTAEGAFTGVASGLQGGVFFGLSLVLGGLFFAARMREKGFTTLVDLFEARFGRAWAKVLSLPAILGELLWCAELLVAMGATCSVLVGLDFTTAILISAVVITLYTMWGGMWSVAITDAFQLCLVIGGLFAVLPFALEKVGGFTTLWSTYTAQKGAASWAPLGTMSFWDMSVMLALGGIPWNCYFQRVLSCPTPRRAALHSVLAGLCTMALTLPPLVLGMVAWLHWKEAGIHPSSALPLLFRDLVPPVIGLLGLAAIVGAVTSSFSASLLSASSLVVWNWFPKKYSGPRTLRGGVLFLGAASISLALTAKSVQQLWFFTSDLVFVLLFPQLVFSLYAKRLTRAASITAFVVSLGLRLGGGEALFGIPRFLPYPEEFPVRVFAAVVGLLLLPLVSRLTVADDARGRYASPLPLGTEGVSRA